MKKLLTYIGVILAMALPYGVAVAAAPAGGHGVVKPGIHGPVDDGSGGGGGAYPSQTGACQIDGGFDGDPNTGGPGDMATFGSRILRCNGNFFYDISGDGFYID